MEPLRIRRDAVIPGAAMTWTAARASGPGGQNVNKVATKVELRLTLEASGLTEAVLARLRQHPAARFDGDGALLVTSQATRSQAQNLEDARRKLADLIRTASTPPKVRRPTRKTRGSERRRLEAKRQNSEKKKLRRPPSD